MRGRNNGHFWREKLPVCPWAQDFKKASAIHGGAAEDNTRENELIAYFQGVNEHASSNINQQLQKNSNFQTDLKNFLEVLE